MFLTSLWLKQGQGHQTCNVWKTSLKVQCAREYQHFLRSGKICLLYDLINCWKKQDLPGLLVSKDFEKVFNSVNWSYMHKVLKAYAFGENICRKILSFYTNIRSSVVVNGKASSSFPLECGFRQGDPILPYLFILCAEVLAYKIRKDKEIKGVQILDSEFKISQFADDISLILEVERSKSYEKHCGVLREFENILGLKLN